MVSVNTLGLNDSRDHSAKCYPPELCNRGEDSESLKSSRSREGDKGKHVNLRSEMRVSFLAPSLPALSSWAGPSTA